MFFASYEPKDCSIPKLRNPEKIAPMSKVVRYGYVPFSKRVQEMEKAGINLLTIRAEMCDFKPDEPIDFDRDFSRYTDMDRFQIQKMQEEIAEKYSKLNEIIGEQKFIEMLRAKGYTVEEAKEVLKASDDNDVAVSNVETTRKENSENPAK